MLAVKWVNINERRLNICVVEITGADELIIAASMYQDVVVLETDAATVTTLAITVVVTTTEEFK